MFPIHMTASNCKSLKQTNFYLAGSMQIKWPNECNKIYFKDHNGEDKFFLLINLDLNNLFFNKFFSSKLYSLSFLSVEKS